MKKGDKIITIVMITILFLFCVGYHYYNKSLKKNNLVAVIKQEGKVIDKINLKNTKSKEFKVKNGEYYNIIKIKDGNVRVEESNCPHHECIKVGNIKKAGQIIACIPNKLIIEIIGEKNRNDVDITSF